MQGNSKYLRWSPLYTCCCIFVILSSTVIAVPIRPRRMVTETYPAFDALNSNTISNVTCLKDGKEVLKSSVECEVKIGCKLIQKTGECCPEYQCDCSHEGVTYKNGERINNNDPCRRCLCKGGEVTCSEISCYIRDDCKPRYMKGVCCPTYDNCPPLDDAKIASSKESDQTASRLTTPRNDAIMSLTTVISTIHKDENTPLLNFANENPLGIKIIEITKPEEIRITDDKPKAFIPKFATTTTTTTTTTAQSPKIEEVTKIQTTESSLMAFSESTRTDSPTITSTATATKKAVDFEDLNQSVNSNEREIHDYMDDGTIDDDKMSGVAAAPPTKPTVKTVDGEVESELLLTGADSNTIGDETSNKSVRQTVENSTSSEIDRSSENSSEFFSSTTENDFDSLIKEVSTTSTENDEVVAMAVTHMPKNIVIVWQGGKTESFHILGTDGLQRVEELDVLGSTTEGGQEDISEIATQSSEQSSVETVTNEPLHSTTEEPSSSESSSVLGESFEDDHTVAIAVDKKLDNTLQTNESITENLTNNSIEVSTPSETVTENISEEVHETVFYAEENDKSTEPTSYDEPIDNSSHGPTENGKDGSSTTEAASDYSSSTFDSSGYSTTEQSTIATTTVTESTTTTPRSSSVEPCVEPVSRSEDEESTLAENPEFPYIPDDLSIHCKQIEEEEKRRLPSKEFHSSTVSNNNKRESLIGLASSEISTISPSDKEIKNSHEMVSLEGRAPGEPLLIPEWERNTTESSLSMESNASGENQTNDIHKTSIWDRYSIEISKENRSESESVEKLTSSSEEKYGNKEPTTARQTTKKYADVIENEDEENVSISSEQSTSTDDTLSPKNDAESIKFNSEGESSAPIASYEGPSFKFIDLAIKDSWRTWAKENNWPF